MAEEGKKRTRQPKVVPQNPGDKDSLGYELVKRNGDQAILKTPKERYTVYQNPWGSEEKCLMKPVKDLSEAEYFLEHGKKKEKPAAKRVQKAAK